VNGVYEQSGTTESRHKGGGFVSLDLEAGLNASNVISGWKRLAAARSAASTNVGLQGMSSRSEIAARNLPLASPPKRTRLDIFGTSAENASALKASSWHSGTQFSLSEEQEEMHGRRAFDEDISLGQCFTAVGSLGAAGMRDTSREDASGTSPLRRKVVSKTDGGGVKVFDRDSAKSNDGGSSGVFEMDMGEEAEIAVASTLVNVSTSSTSVGPPGNGASREPQQKAVWREESFGPGGEQGAQMGPKVQMDGGVFAMDAEEDAGASTKGRSLLPMHAADTGDEAQKEMPEDVHLAAASSEAAESTPSEAEASALAVLHAMAAGVVSPPNTHAHKDGNWSIGAAASAAANAANTNSQQLPVLVKSDGTTMVVSEDFLTKMGIPLMAPAASNAQPTPSHALQFPLESPSTTAASGFMGMSLDTPKGARLDAANGVGVPINTSCAAVLKAIDVLSPRASSKSAESRTDKGMHSASSQMAALAESIAGSADANEHTGAADEGEEGLSMADEAAIAALQELGASGGRWAREGGRGSGSRAGESPSGSGNSSINSRHGAARGRQVTRSCPGCSERISIACKFCTLCGYTFRRSSTQSSQPSTPRDSMLSPARAVDVSVGALAAAAAAAATEATMTDGGVDGGKTLGALLKRAKGAGASPDKVLAAVGIVLGTPGENRSKMTTPVKLEGGCSGAGTPRGFDAHFGEPSIVKRESPDGSAAAGGGAGMGEFDRSPGAAGTTTPRQTVTRVTANSLELHKIKEQARRAREKQLLARLQSLLFDGRESPPSASEVTYNLVLTCAVESLRDRFIRRGHDLSHLNIDEAIAPEPSMTPRNSAAGSHSSVEMEKHKIKEQQRRAKKRQLLSTLQSIVLGETETNSKGTGITGNYIMELVVVQLEKERIETAGAAPAALAAVKTEVESS